MYRNITNPEDACRFMLSLSHVTTSHGKLELSFYIIIFLLIMFSNITLIYGLVKTKEIKTNTARLLTALSIGDLLTALVHIPTHITFTHLQRKSCIGYSMESFFAVFLGTSATIITSAMCLDRYLFISRPYKHPKTGTSKYLVIVYLVLAYSISLSLAISVVIVALSDFGFRLATIFNIISSTIYVLILLTSLVVNTLLYSYIRNQTKEIKRLSNSHIQQRGYKRKATKTVLIISIIQIFTITPWVISLIYMTVEFGEKKYLEYMDTIYYAHVWLRMPVFLNSFF
eukprot:TCONS_00060010-protein